MSDKRRDEEPLIPSDALDELRQAGRELRDAVFESMLPAIDELHRSMEVLKERMKQWDSDRTG